MTDRPLLFSAPMVRALIEGRKTQTRRIIKKPAALDALNVFGPKFLMKPGNADLTGYSPGDRIWVRETWTDLATQPQCDLSGALGPGIAYRATDDDECTIPAKWRPAIHMPRTNSRLTLLVTEVRVERLQDCSEADALAEGVPCGNDYAGSFSAEFCQKCGGSSVHGAFGAGYGVTEVDCADCATAQQRYRNLWEHINGPGAWDANPWIEAVSFTVHQCNIDQMPGGAA